MTYCEIEVLTHAKLKEILIAFPDYWAMWERKLEITYELASGDGSQNIFVSLIWWLTISFYVSEIKFYNLIIIVVNSWYISCPNTECLKIGLQDNLPEDLKIYVKSQRTSAYTSAATEGDISDLELIRNTRDTIEKLSKVLQEVEEQQWGIKLSMSVYKIVYLTGIICYLVSD